MAFPRKIKNFNAFVDGISYFGLTTAAAMPEIAVATSDYRGGGMDQPVAIDMGLEAMTAELTFAEFRPEIYAMIGTRQLLVLRAAMQAQADVTDADALVLTMRGKISKLAGSELGAGNDVTKTITMSLDRYRVEIAGATLVDIDVEAGRRIIGGVDQTAAARRSMGL
jgi:P2 family phage contractile tail tube protein